LKKTAKEVEKELSVVIYYLIKGNNVGGKANE
jgi:hypothetical protein